MSYPKLTFDLDINFDKWTAENFLKEEDTLFVRAITDEYPPLKGKQEDLTFVTNYVEEAYKKLEPELERAKVKAEKAWGGVEKPYFDLVEKLFKRKDGSVSPWPEGTYICFMSMFNCNPRFIEEKEFQVYYKHPYGSNAVCMHEMLHFIFYAYLESEFPKEYKERGEDYIWKLSEVFNDVVLRLPEFVELTSVEKPDIYAQTEEELKETTQLWEKSNGVSDFLKAYFEVR